MMGYLRINERKNATVTAFAEKRKIMPGEDPDVSPMDIGAVVAGPAAAQREGGRGHEKDGNATRE